MKKRLALLLALMMLLSVVFPGCGKEDAASGDPGAVPETLDEKSFMEWLGSGQKLRNVGETEHSFRLTESIELTQEVRLDGRSVTLDLNGNKISAGKVRAFHLTGGASLTLVGGTLETKGDDSNGGVLLLVDSNLTLDNMKVLNTDDSHISGHRAGGVIYATGESENAGTVTLKGGTELTGSPSGLRRSGGSIVMAGKTKLIIEDATVQNGTAGTAGNILLEGNATLQLLPGSTVKGGHAVRSSEISGSGGNITGYAMSQIHLEGGLITEGKADRNGGNVYLSNTAGGASGIHIYSGTVEKGVASTDGGNIYATEKFSLVRIYGGNLQDGKAARGGNVALQKAKLLVMGGTFTGTEDAESLLYGGNVYAVSSTVNIYGGTITGGKLYAAQVQNGGGNLFVGGDSLLNIYGGEIREGVSNCEKEQEPSAAGGNVMIAGNTLMQMFGGIIKDGMVYGAITRGGGVYVYGQVARTNPVFHMYGGVIENGALENKMRGQCIGSYSETSGTSGIARTRIFGGEIRYTGPDNSDKIYVMHGNKKMDLYLFTYEQYPGMYNRTIAEPCPDESHNTVTGEQAATCLTHGLIAHDCETCGVWYEITEEPLGHQETTDGNKHSCSVCDVIWYE